MSAIFGNLFSVSNTDTKTTAIAVVYCELEQLSEACNFNFLIKSHIVLNAIVVDFEYRVFAIGQIAIQSHH